jgi:hypothetical protein
MMTGKNKTFLCMRNLYIRLKRVEWVDFNMAERNQLIDSESIHYSGLVDFRELYLMLEKWMAQNGYKKNEVQNTEKIYEKKKHITWVFYPTKVVADFVALEIRITMNATDVTEVVIRDNKTKKKIQNAKVKVSFDAFYKTNDESRLREDPLRTFIRTFHYKFLSNKFENKYQGQVVSDVNNLRDNVRSFLKLHRYHEIKE